MLNQKKINSLLLLLILVVPILISPNQYQIDGETEEILESNNNLASIDPISNDVEPSTKQSVINYDTIYQGESVKTDIEFNKQSIEMPIENVWSTLGTDPDYKTYGYENIYVDDGNLAYFVSTRTDGVKTEGGEAKFYMKLYCGGSGVFTYEWYMYFTYYEATVTKGGPLPTKDSTLTVTSSMLDSQGFLHLMFWGTYTATYGLAYFYYIDFTGETSITVASQSGLVVDGVKSYNFRIDEFQFVRDTITSNARLVHRYTSENTLAHKLVVPSVPHAKEINIYYPEHLTYLSINPSASVTDSSYILTINSPTELTYTVHFSSLHEDLLFVNDITSTAISFDSDWENGQIGILNRPALFADTIEIESSIVFSGSNSLKVTDDDSGSPTYMINFPYDCLGTGVYYIQVSFLIEAAQTGEDIAFFWIDYVSGNYYSETCTDFEFNRWYTVLFMANITQSYDYSTMPEPSYFGFALYDATAGDTIIYFDNFKVFRPSTTIKTINSYQHTVESTLISIDGYENPLQTNKDARFFLADVLTPRTHLTDYRTKTNSLGVATWNYNSELDLTNYIIYAWSEANYWNPYGQTKEICMRLDSWEGIGQLYYAESYNAETNELNFILRAAGFSYLKYVQSPYINWYEDIGFMVYELKTNDTGSSYITRHYSYESPYTGTYRINDTATTYWSDEYIEMVQHMDFWRWQGTVNPDASFVYFMLHQYYTATDHVLFTIRDFHFSHAVKTYFEPQAINQIDYAYTELNDAWDFADDLDNWGTLHAEFDDNLNYRDGVLYSVAEAGITDTYVYFDYMSTASVDASYYTHFAMKFRTNVTICRTDPGGASGEIYLYDNHWGNMVVDVHGWDDCGYGNGGFLADKWYEFVVLIDDAAWTGTETDFQILFSNSTVAFEEFTKIEIEYIKLVHINPFLEETNDYPTDELNDAWDFEEDTEYYTISRFELTDLTNGIIHLTKNVANSYPCILFSGVNFNPTLYDYVIKLRTVSLDFDSTQIWFQSSTNHFTEKVYIDNNEDFITLNLADNNLDNPVTTITIYFFVGDAANNFEVYIDYVRIIKPQELPYSVIQNSVLLESESNDLQYNLYLDHNFIGTFPDLSLIPLIASVGTHYLQVQPFRTDQAYITQNVYSYYYTIEAAAFSVNVGSFYLSDTYVNTYVTSNYDYAYYVYEDDDPIGDGSGYKEGTTVSSNRDTTAGVTIAYAIKFVYSSEIVWFNTSYSNSRTAFYVEEYKIDIQEENIQIIWSTTKSDIDSLTVYEGTVLKVDAEEDSPSSWVKSTTVGVHYVTLIFEAVTYGSIIYSFNYEIVLEVFEINIESFHLSELYVSTYVTASENGNYQVYENNTVVGSEGTLQSIGTSIQTDRNTTADTFINYAIKFWNAESDVIWFNTTYSNVEGDFFVIEYSVNIGETTITVTWSTSLPDSDELTVKEDGANKVTDDTESPSDWPKSTVVGTHSVVLLFESDGYATITYSFNYHIYAVADFQVDVGSFQVSDDYVNTYVSSNYDGNYYVYEDNIQIDTGILYGSGTVIETNRDTTAGVTISYAIKFVYEAIEIWFNTSYSNPVTPFYLTDYRVVDGITITITWNTTIPSLDSLTIYEDGDLKAFEDPESTTAWTKSTEVGNHYVTLIFSAAGYDDIIHSFAYTVLPPTAFSIDIDTFYVTDDYVNMYLTANFDYTYTVYENNTEIGTGNGMAVGTTIISPKNKEAGLYNFTIIFTYNSETIPFMTWYSNLIPPLHPLNDLWRMESQGFYNISVYSNLEFYWIDIYHDDSLIIDDSTATFFSIEKGLKVGWHNITLVYTYNCSTNAEGYPVAEYNVTIAYEFNYETTFFYDVTIRYIEDLIGIAISEINVNDFKTYLDGELVLHGDIDDVEIYSNYSYISNYDIRIKNTIALHDLIVKDLLGTTILDTTIDISSFTSKIIELPIYLLGMINLDTATHKIGVKYQPWTDSSWKLSPELPQGAFIKFWFCGGTYGLRLYNATIYYDEAGNPYKQWHEYTDLPPGILPYTIIIPLTLDVIGPDPIEEKVNITMWVAIAILVLAAVFIIVNWRIRKRKKS